VERTGREPTAGRGPRRWYGAPVLTSAHAYWTWRALRGRPRAPWAVLGAAIPDLPGVTRALPLAAGGLRGTELMMAVYHRPGWREVHRAAHSAVVLAAAAVLGRRSRRVRALALGWAGHLAVDYACHSTDAWPPFWPLSARSYPSPVSYWERERHAAVWSRAETLALILATLRGPRGLGRLAGLAVAAGAAVPLVRRDVWRWHRECAIGPDPPAP
jgi:hypothetical protein